MTATSEPTAAAPPVATDRDRPTGGGGVVAIANPQSGSAGSKEALVDAFPVPVELVDTTEQDPGTGQARAAVAGGADTVVACGGDGTVRAVLEGVVGSTAALGVVPLGTGNLLAANLDIPTDLAEAAGIAVRGTIRTLDVGVVNDERFAVMSGVGFDACMIRDANPRVKRRLGSVAYVVSAIRNAPARLTGAVVTVDGERVWSGRTAMVLVGNCGTVTGGLAVFPDARPDDGALDVAVLSATNLREWCSVMVRLVRSKPQRPDLVARFTGRQIEVDLRRALPYELDGEDRPPTRNLRYSIEPGAVRVRGGQAPSTDAATS